eukprot:m.280400 g.280400  ORF g.280400 m.280400 type:complete len:194 (-) comp16168_c0_seq1:618-1199(-)
MNQPVALNPLTANSSPICGVALFMSGRNVRRMRFWLELIPISQLRSGSVVSIGQGIGISAEFSIVVSGSTISASSFCATGIRLRAFAASSSSNSAVTAFPVSVCSYCSPKPEYVWISVGTVVSKTMCSRRCFLAHQISFARATRSSSSNLAATPAGDFGPFTSSYRIVSIEAHEVLFEPRLLGHAPQLLPLRN